MEGLLESEPGSKVVAFRKLRVHRNLALSPHGAAFDECISDMPFRPYSFLVPLPVKPYAPANDSVKCCAKIHGSFGSC